MAEEEDLKRCWICFVSDGEETAPHTKRWVSPCACRGDTKWAHESCLLSWIDAKQAGNSNRRVQCPQCRRIYRMGHTRLTVSALLVGSVGYVHALVDKTVPFGAAYAGMWCVKVVLKSYGTLLMGLLADLRPADVLRLNGWDQWLLSTVPASMVAVTYAQPPLSVGRLAFSFLLARSAWKVRGTRLSAAQQLGVAVLPLTSFLFDIGFAFCCVPSRSVVGPFVIHPRQNGRRVIDFRQMGFPLFMRTLYVTFLAPFFGAHFGDLLFKRTTIPLVHARLLGCMALVMVRDACTLAYSRAWKMHAAARSVRSIQDNSDT